MTEEEHFENVSAEVSSDGVSLFNRRTGESISFGFDDLREIADWFGFVRADQYARIESAFVDVCDQLRDNHLGDASSQNRVLDQYDPGTIIGFVTPDGKYVGVVTDSQMFTNSTEYGYEETKSIRLIFPSGRGGFKIVETHDSGNRDYPGYHGVDTVELTVAGETKQVDATKTW